MNAVIDNSLARGLVRQETRSTVQRFERTLDPRAWHKGRFGKRVRDVRSQIRAAQEIVLDEQMANGWHTFLSLLTEKHGDQRLMLTSLHKREGVRVIPYPYGITTHCRERMLQQQIATPKGVLESMVLYQMDRHVSTLNGWLATPEALWRVNDGMFATVIKADRLDTHRYRYARLMKHLPPGVPWVFDADKESR